MAHALSDQLYALVNAMALGRSSKHPLAGWQVLTILYHDGASAEEAITLRYLLRTYNNEYRQPDEEVISLDGLRGILAVLIDEVQLVESTSRMIRKRLANGRFRISQTAVYRITSAGIAFLTAMQRVIDAETTVVASTKRIDEFVADVHLMRDRVQWETSTEAFYTRFGTMMEAYHDVMNGMRKLDIDLREIATDLSFSHAGDVAKHLQAMLHEQAVPAYQKLQQLAPAIVRMGRDEALVAALALSSKGLGSIDVHEATSDEEAKLVARRELESAIKRQLQGMAQSFEGTTTAIQSSMDSIYLLFNTLWEMIKLLTAEYDHVQRQTVDIKTLTTSIDALLAKSAHLVMPGQLPRHLPLDRLTEDQKNAIAVLPPSEQAAATAEMATALRTDLLEAGAMPAIRRALQDAEVKTYTEADNPQLVDGEDLASGIEAGQAEFRDLVMVDDAHGEVSRPLIFQTKWARDQTVFLYSATNYADPLAFAVDGRQLTEATPLPDSGPVQLQVAGEAFAVELPHGFAFTFEKG
ncbi:hypothetical protein [Lacticaseibacillus mingshuiensis]|uniref:Uncharacterized protein n=1 Tax=Lacticaseibacillus mingshuiensis TaxID=2799574 RepID=A0ABW4CDH8_9LACO|nr:hypothetical protein [Lacticaseibacillus mingshuiensis]